jgi:potassium-dependent mechanosensitive channel
MGPLSGKASMTIKLNSSRFLFYLAIIFIGGFFYLEGAGLLAADNAPADGAEERLPSIDEIRQKIKKTTETIQFFSAADSDQVSKDRGIKAADIEKRLLALSSLRSNCERLTLAMTDLETIEKEKMAAKDRYDDYRTKGMATKPPYTLTFLDSIQERLLSAERDQKNIDLTIEQLRQETGEHKKRLKTLEKELRQNEEKLKSTEGDDKKPVRWIADENRINIEALQILIRAKNTEIKRYELKRDHAAIQIELYTEQSALVKANVRYDNADLKHQLEALEQKKTGIQTEIERLRAEQKSIEKEWLRAQQALESIRQGDDRTVAEAYLNSRNEWRRTYQVVLELKERAILLLDRQIQTWQKRYALVQGEFTADQLNELKKEVEKNLDNLSQTLQIEQNLLVGLQKQLSSIESRTADENVSESVQKNLSAQISALRKQVERRLEYQSVILAADQVEKRLLNEIVNTMGQLTIKEHLTGFKDNFIDFWNIEIWEVDGLPVTLRKVAVALFVLIIGILLAKIFLSMIRNRFLAKSQFKETTASGVHKILSYSAYLLVCLFALRIVNIPLTAFAFLGGAIAIGIGFGAQNLINNFISGFIILGERPIHIGDLIDVDGVLGMVEEIGARCTRVRTGENIHILVPNSSFLEKNITNWTLSDKKIRANIVVGVSYGSPVSKVEALLTQAVKQVSRVLTHPEPFVLFSEFGDNALIFHAYFWIGIRRIIERRQIESDVRFEIDELFAEEGIVIAFPQRDVHLDSEKPIHISLIEKENEDDL